MAKRNRPEGWGQKFLQKRSEWVAKVNWFKGRRPNLYPKFQSGHTKYDVERIPRTEPAARRQPRLQAEYLYEPTESAGHCEGRGRDIECGRACHLCDRCFGNKVQPLPCR